MLSRSILSPIEGEQTEKARVRLFLKRDDLLHPTIQGNKWRKLASLVARMSGPTAPKGVISFGGPFSNHLHALAAAGQHYGFETVGVLRGEYVDLQNPTLRFAQNCGMRLFPVSKRAYDTGVEHPQVAAVLAQFPDYECLPEGGATPEAVADCAHIAKELLAQLRSLDVPSGNLFVCVPAGTGCTAAGLARGLRAEDHLVTFPVDERIDAAHIAALAAPAAALPHIHTMDAYRFGGFAKFPGFLRDFVVDFEKKHGILMDPIYGTKMMYGVFDLIEQGFFPNGAIVVALHTGGLQGWAGMDARLATRHK